MSDHLDSKNLIPFAKRRNSFQLPGARKDRDEQMLEEVDPDLTPEDEGVIRRYLQYADTLLGSPDTDGFTLVPGGGPAKNLAAIPEKDRHVTAASSSAQEENQDGHLEESEARVEGGAGGSDQAA
ncbi:MAG TPA: hypothetical protein VJV96_11555 [Candidatus Angelobacter sp.]|nr:hypothetical protein [Candidatus Angelobacter sp.]